MSVFLSLFVYFITILNMSWRKTTKITETAMIMKQRNIDCKLNVVFISSFYYGNAT